ncbi:MAG: hypothetical protein C0615_12270 [Desulfuromonas sp.]|nr:MAG: hypothetical protein C0615_12270 [Desulfuromonas sp.]
MNRSALNRIFLLFIFFSSVASPTWAVQAHGGAEGLVSHQIGHILFTIGMAYLLLRLRTIRFQKKGWFEFKLFLVLLIAWNIMTFTGHWMNEIVPAEKFVKSQNHTATFRIDNLFDGIYYATRLDHLILVPSFLFLLVALKKWRREV